MFIVPNSHFEKCRNETMETDVCNWYTRRPQRVQGALSTGRINGTSGNITPLKIEILFLTYVHAFTPRPNFKELLKQKKNYNTFLLRNEQDTSHKFHL